MYGVGWVRARRHEVVESGSPCTRRAEEPRTQTRTQVCLLCVWVESETVGTRQRRAAYGHRAGARRSESVAIILRRAEARSLNLLLKTVKCDETEPGRAWDAVLGDDTGVVTFSLRSAEHAELCKAAGRSVRVQNARVVMAKGFIRVVVDKWAVMKPADAAAEFEPKSDKDISATEYELS